MLETIGRALRRPVSALAGLGAALAIAAIWVALTAATGKTYHLAPLLVEAAPGAIARVRAPAPAPGLAVVTCGLVTVAVGWLAIVAVRIEPEATVISGQPGGVVGEVILGAVAGGLLGAALAPPPPKPVAGGRKGVS